MRFKMNKKIAVVLAVLILTLSIGSATFAAGSYKNLKAWYNNIKIFKNGTQVQLDFEPFIIDGYTYVPLRAVGELFNKDFVWDGVNYTINITDRPDSNLNAMMTQIVTQQQTIATLEAKVKSLEAEAAKKPTVSSLSDLENKLNKDYGTYKDVDFDIDLYESKGNIEARIYVDLYYDASDWKYITSSNLKTYLQDIVDDIRKEYKDAKVTGFIEDNDKKKELVTFITSTKGVVSVNEKSSGGSSGSNYLWELEDDLNDYYYKYDGINFVFKLKEGNNYIDATIEVDSWDWDRYNYKNTFLNEVGYEIQKEFPRYTVYMEVVGSDYPYKSLDSYTY